MASQPHEIDRDIEVPSAEREVAVGRVEAGETWSFSATGRWTNGLVRSGPAGYRNFLADALEIAPRVAGHPWFSLIGEIKGHPGTTFPIAAGCTQTFDRSGTLVAFANDSEDGYSNNEGAVTLTLRRGGVAAATGAEFGGVIGWWQAVRDMMRRTKGIPFIAALTVGVSAILVFMQQGRDLVRGVGEDDFWQYPSGLLQIAFALGLLFLAFQAWSWSRIIITSNYGADRAKWRPKQLLIWTPRVLGALPFAATAWALFKNPARNSWFVFALIAVGLLFFAFVIRRQDVAAPLRRRAARLGRARHFDLIQRYWVIFSFAAAAVLMAAAAIWPARLGALLGAPAIVFIGLGLIIPIAVIGIQIGSALRIPVVGAMLLWAVVVGLWMDNHAIGRRAFAAATTGPIDRPTLKEAYRTVEGGPAGGQGGENGRWCWSPCRAAPRGPATGRRSPFRTCGKPPRPKASTSMRIFSRSVRCPAAASGRSAMRRC